MKYLYLKIDFNIFLKAILLRVVLLICCNFYVSNIISQTIADRYKPQFEEFVAAFNNENWEQASEKLEAIKTSPDFTKNDTLKGMYFISYGNYFYFQDLFDKAKDAYLQAIKYCDKAKYNSGFITSNQNLGALYGTLSLNDSALYYHKIALSLAEQEKNQKEINKISISIAVCLKKKGQFVDANNILFQILKQCDSSEAEVQGNVLSAIAANYKELYQNEIINRPIFVISFFSLSLVYNIYHYVF